MKNLILTTLAVICINFLSCEKEGLVKDRKDTNPKLKIAAACQGPVSFEYTLTWGNVLEDRKYPTSAEGRTISIDNAGNVTVAGIFRGTVDFDPGSGENILVFTKGSLTSFILRTDASGNFLNASTPGTSTSYTPWPTDAFDNKYITYRRDISNDSLQIAVLKEDPKGNLLGEVYLNKLGYTGTVSSNIRISKNGDVYIATGGDYLYKFNSKGQLIWKRMLPKKSIEAPFLEIDEKGNVYVTPGKNYQENNDRSWVAKYDTYGKLKWAVNNIGTGGGHALTYAIGVDEAENVYLGGSFDGTVDFDPGQGTYNLSAPDFLYGEDGFVQKLSISGKFIWTVKTKGMQNSGVRPLAIKIDKEKNVYITGSYSGVVDFTGRGVFVGIRQWRGISSAFLVKLKQCD